VALLERFSPPGNLSELDEDGRAAWSERVAGLVEELAGGEQPQFFNPLKNGDGSGGAAPSEHAVVWPAFPGTLLSPGGSDTQRWEQADSSRDEQDEYCEWGVERSGDDIARVTFTTETPDYFDQLMRSDPAQLLERYRELAGAAPASVEELQGPNGGLDASNAFNRPESGGIVHLSQASNTLSAAVILVAQATVLREKDGQRVTEKKALVRCGKLGEALRNSDPQIASAVNQLVASGDELSVADPAGLYIDEFIAAGITTPDGADPAEFWQVVPRGDEEHALRARFEVPAERGYSVSDVEIDGRPIEFGAQLADRVRVRVVALARPGSVAPVPQPCKG
jgi:hypothetical protein